jgi:toxin ParE1/3/4
MGKIRRSADAIDDLSAIWRYIAKDNPSAADRLLQEIDRALERIVRFPLIGESVDHLRQGTRRVMVGNYQLFYELASSDIHLLRVYHAARRIEDLF